MTLPHSRWLLKADAAGCSAWSVAPERLLTGRMPPDAGGGRVARMARRTRGRPTPQQALAVAKDPFIYELVAACSTARNGLELSARERDRVVEDAFFRAAAALETFLSEWLVRCLSFDASAFRRTYEMKAANWAVNQLNTGWEPSDRLWKERGGSVSVTIHLPISKKHSLEETRTLLGAVDDNVTIRRTEDLIRLAKEYLVDRYARRSRDLGPQCSAVLDATVAIRNVLAHRSARATEQMNRCLRSSNLPSSLRRQHRAVSSTGVGYYLQAAAAGRPRFERYLELLAEIGHRLAPTRGRKKTICP